MAIFSCMKTAHYDLCGYVVLQYSINMQRQADTAQKVCQKCVSRNCHFALFVSVKRALKRF